MQLFPPVKTDVALFTNENAEVTHNSFHVPYGSAMFQISQSSSGTYKQVEGAALLFPIMSLFAIFKTLIA